MNNRANREGVFVRAPKVLRKISRAIGAVLAVLGFGLVVNTAIFTFGYLQFAGLYPHPDELVVLRAESHDRMLSAGDFLRWREQSTVFQDLHASTEGAFSITTQAGLENIPASLVTTGFYRMMGDPFYLGNDFTPEDGAPGQDHVVILAHAMWKRLGADPAIIGSTILLNGEAYTVVGVLAPGLRDRGAPVTVPLVFKPEPLYPSGWGMNVMGRLKPGITIQKAQADVNAVVARNHLLKSKNAWSVSVEPMQAASLPNERKLVLRVMLGVVAFVLLIASASVANLLRLRSEAGYQLRVFPSSPSRSEQSRRPRY
jgi:putative ABC transport system permease protein